MNSLRPSSRRSSPAVSPRWLLNRAYKYLRSCGVPEPGPKAEYLLAEALNVKRTDLWVHGQVPSSALNRFSRHLKGMARWRVPLAYILGHQDFAGLKFAVKPKVTLIPRPETEILVETIVGRVQNDPWIEGTLKICDVGTGTGCIALALWKFLSKSRRASFWASDISAKALKVARMNARYLGCPGRAIKWIQGPMFSPFSKSLKFDVIASNPPYISEVDYQNLPPEIKNWEPREALLSGPSGTEFLELLINQSAGRLNPGGLLAMEIGYNQAKAVKVLLRKKSFKKIEFVKDYQGFNRVALARALV